jgi:hypothetical protein
MIRQEFGPTEDRRSIIISDEHFECDRSERIDFAISRLDLETGRTTWRLNRAVLEKRIGHPISAIQLAAGPARPCTHLPLLIKTRDAMPSILWRLDVKSGQLDGPTRIPWIDDSGATLSPRNVPWLDVTSAIWSRSASPVRDVCC